MSNQTRLEAFNSIKNVLKKLDFITDETASEITEETSVKGLMDNLDIVELTMELEKELNRQITDSCVEGWKTFKDIVDTYLIIKDNE